MTRRAPRPRPGRAGAMVRRGSRLDATDERIIESLIRDGRLSYAALRPVTNLTTHANRDRVRRLLGSGAISLAAVPAPALFGHTRTATLLITGNGPSLTLHNALTGLGPHVTDAAIVLGRYSATATVRARDDADAARRVEQVASLDGVQDVRVVPHVRTIREGGRPAGPHQLRSRPVDDTDRRLAALMIEDPRISLADLSRRTGIASTTVRLRVVGLIADRLLTVTAHRTPTGRFRCGFGLTLTRATAETVAAGIDRLGGELTHLAIGAGPFTIIGQADTRDRAAFVDVCDRIRATSGVAAVSTWPLIHPATKRPE